VAQHTISVTEARLADAVVRLVDPRVGVQHGVGHDPVDEVVDDGGDCIDPAETVIEHGLGGLCTHRNPSLCNAGSRRRHPGAPEESWRHDADEADAVREWGEVVPDDGVFRKDAPVPRRSLALRVRQKQGALFADGSDVRHFCIVSLLTGFSRIGLPEDLHTARPKPLRFLVRNTVGKVVRHAREPCCASQRPSPETTSTASEPPCTLHPQP
jgi:hypothetical protein